MKLGFSYPFPPVCKTNDSSLVETCSTASMATLRRSVLTFFRLSKSPVWIYATE